MPDRLTCSMTPPPPDVPLPLGGVTVLVVDDSRLACEALRLMCRRLGAQQVRRAESLRAAGVFLRLFQPDVAIVDLGLPDGRGEALIASLSKAAPRPLVLGLSGDGAGRARAMGAGADGYLDKPLESFAKLQDTLLSLLPEAVAGDSPYRDLPLALDPLALRDDLAHAARLLEADLDPSTLRYVAAFLGGVATHAHDQALAHAAQAAPLPALRAALAARLAGPDRAFAPSNRVQAG